MAFDMVARRAGEPADDGGAEGFKPDQTEARAMIRFQCS